MEDINGGFDPEATQTLGLAFDMVGGPLPAAIDRS